MTREGDEVIEAEGNYRLVLTPQMYDIETADPRIDTNVGIMACSHPRYDLGDDDVGDVVDAMDHLFRTHKSRIASQALARWLRLKYGATVVKPLYLYDHSGISISTGTFTGDSAGWDTSLVGVIYDTDESREQTGVSIEKVEQAIDEEVKLYDLYLTGEVYGYAVERKVFVTTVRRAEEGGDVLSETTGEEWDEVEACWNFLGRAAAVTEGRESLASYLT